MSDGTIRSGKLAGRTLPAAIRILAMPVLVQQTMQAFVGLTDKVLAGHLPAADRLPGMDAIGIGSYVGWLIGIALSGLGIGGQALIARGMGGGDLPLAHRALGQATVLAASWSVFVALLLVAVALPLARISGLSAEATTLYLEYMHAIALGVPGVALMQVGAMCMYGAGETARPSIIAFWVNVVNVGMSWVLSGVDVRFGDATLVNPFDFDLGVRGIALGTTLGWLVGAALTVRTLVRGMKDLRLERADLRWDGAMARRIVRLGVPQFLEGLAMWAVNLFVLMMIGAIASRHAAGEGLQGAHIIAIQWEAFSFLPGFAIGTAAGTLAGQYLGAGNERMARRAVIVCAVIASALMGAFGIVFMTLGEPLVAVMSREPVHLEVAPRLLFICGTVQVFFATAMVVRQGLAGVGDTRATLALTVVSSYLVRLPACWLLAIHLDLGMSGLWVALCGEFVVRAGLFVGRFVHGGWVRVRV